MENISVETFKKACTMNYAGLIGYVMAVGERIGREEALKILAELHAKMAGMVKESLPRLGIEGNDARAGAKLLEMVINEHNPVFKLFERRQAVSTPQRVVTEHRGFCPVLEACQMLGVAVKDFCLLPHEEGLTPLVQVLNPDLQVKLGKLRPEADCCELIVELK